MWSAILDGDREEHDRRADRRLAMPVLAAWQDPGDQLLPFDPERIWAAWAHELRTLVLPCGHFLPEERPDAVADAIVKWSPAELAPTSGSSGKPRAGHSRVRGWVDWRAGEV